MKKIFLVISLLITTIFFTACNAEPQVSETSTDTAQNTVSSSSTNNTTSSNNATPKLIRLTTTDNQIITLELNDSTASNDLYNQLPLTIELENYSNNEKIFYPPQKLSTENTPLAHSNIGTLAYYEPWGDVVIFYGDFRSNNSLYELGHVISGVDLLSQLSGRVTIEAVSN